MWTMSTRWITDGGRSSSACVASANGPTQKTIAARRLALPVVHGVFTVLDRFLLLLITHILHWVLDGRPGSYSTAQETGYRAKRMYATGLGSAERFTETWARYLAGGHRDGHTQHKIARRGGHGMRNTWPTILVTVAVHVAAAHPP